MRTLLLLGLTTLALATSRIPNPRWLEEIIPERGINDDEFRSGREYVFEYNGQLLNGLPQSSKQHSATRIHAVCQVGFKTQTEVLLKCTHIRMGKLNGHIPEPRKMLPFGAFEEVPIERELKEQLQAPLQFTYQNGMISDVVFDGIEKPWSANIKRGVLNMLQVNLKQRGRTDRSEEALRRPNGEETEDKEKDYFTAVEKTLEGECECDYTINSQPWRRVSSNGPMLELTKSVNFEKCRKRPEIKYNYRFSTPCPTCEKKYTSEEKILRSSTVTKFQIKGDTDKFLIEKSICDSQYVHVPMGEEANVMQTYVKQELVLRNSRELVNPDEPENPIKSDTNMIYTHDWDILKEVFFKKGEQIFHEQTPYPGIKNKIEFVEQILRRLVRSISESVEEEAPRQFVRLVTALRTCKSNELTEIHQNFFKNTPSSFTPEDHKKIKDLLVDAMAVAGTKDCVTHLIRTIKNHEIHPVKASLSIKNLINIRVPGKEIIEEMKKLSEDDVCDRSPVLKQSVMLTRGSMIHALCGEHEDKLAVEWNQERKLDHCPITVKLEYVETLFSELRSADTTAEKMLILNTIGNAGLDLSIFELEKIIKDRTEPTIIRLQAMMSLRLLRRTMPRKIQKVLMPVFMNERKEQPQVRLLAAYQVLQTLPERSLLDQMTRQMFKEQDGQVSALLVNQLQSFANSTNPCEQRVADDLKLSLRRASISPMSRLANPYSYTAFHRLYSKKLDKGVGLDSFMVFFNSSYVPSHMGFSLHMNSMGQWFKNVLKLAVVQKGASKWLLETIYSPSGPVERSLEQILRRSPRSLKSVSPQNELKKIFEKLEIVERSSGSSNPMVMPILTIKDHVVSFLPIMRNTIPESIRRLVEDDRINMQPIERVLSQGTPINVYQAFMLFDQSRKIPTSLGLPIRFSTKLPVVMRLSGQVKAEITPTNQIEKVKVTFDVKPSVAAQWTVKMESWSPIVNSGLKINGQGKLYLPIDCNIKVDTSTNPTETELKCKPKQSKYEVVSLETRPVCYTYEWPKFLQTWEEPEMRTIYGDEWNRVNTFDSEIGEQALGFKLRAEGSWHRSPSKRVSGTPICPFSGPNKLKLTVEPGQLPPQEVVVRLTGKLFEKMSTPLTPEFGNFYDKEDKSYFRSGEKSSSSEESHEEFNTREPINSQVELKIFTQGSSIKRNGQINANCKCSERQRHCRCDLDIKRSPVPGVETDDWKLESHVETFYPETPFRLSDLSEDKKFLCNAKASWGQNKEKKVDIKIQGSRTEKQIEQQRKEQREHNWECSSPICQYEMLKRAAVLTDYKIDIDYELGKKEQNITNALYRMIKYNYYWQTSVDQIQVNNPENQVRARITIDPKNRQYINVTIKTPTERCQIKDIPMPIKIEPVNLRTRSSRVRSTSEYLQKMIEPNMAQCEIRPRTVQTFDGVRMRVPFSQSCYSVLAKDCSRPENPRFAVLTKKDNDDQTKKQVKILTRQHIIKLWSKADGEIECEINGEVKSIERIDEVQEHGHVVVRVSRVGLYVKVSLTEAGVKVYFDGSAINIKMSQLYKNMQCGVCGHYDGESYNDLRTSKHELVEDLREFHRSYLLQDQCELEEYMNNREEYSFEPVRRRVGHSVGMASSSEDKEVIHPNGRKSGFCPGPWIIEPVCIEQCSKDTDCDGELKCCFNTCGHTCVPKQANGPIDPTKPVEMTKMIEHFDELCFSKEPVTRCRRNTYPIEYEVEQKVVYGCLPRSDPLAQEMRRDVLQDKVSPRASELPSKFTQAELISKKCEAY